MTLKKRMFRSNMKILFSALLALMAVFLLVLVIFEDSFEKEFHRISQTELDSHVEEVVRIIEDDRMQTAGDLKEKVEGWGYRTAVIAGDRILSGDRDGQMGDLAELFCGKEETGGQPEIFVYQKATVVSKYLPGENAYLTAAHFPEENWLSASLRQSFAVFLLVILLIGLGAIAVLLFLASFFTRKMNRVIMEPVEKLVEAAERIRNGRLDEDIQYQGEEEFEHVCRTFNSMQRTMLEDQRQREKNEKARTDMVTGISHDLRTPLTSIQGYIKGVLDGVADTEEKKKMYLRTAYESTEDMNILLQKLFDFSRMESGQMPFHMVKADLGEYTAAYAAQKESVSDPCRLQIKLSVPKTPMREISMDVEQIRRIFDNLLENSMKYAMVTPVQVDISVREAENSVILEWKDNGRGVPGEKLGRIFERFYRCDEARQEKGSGVGLYVVKYIMERHHGSAEAENDGGLKIRLAFPAASADSE